jgi:two-component system phosphate regulon sensor histidine kinase PhoR
MKNSTIRLFVFFAVISLLGMASIQFFWLSKAFDLKEKEFDHQVQVALQQVAEHLMQYYNMQSPSNDVVEQLSENYFVVMINSQIDGKLLEDLLKAEFTKRNLLTDFEYGIYDCQNEQMVYGNYVSVESIPENKGLLKELPKWEAQPYYFGVYFPNRASTLVGQMGIWLFSSGMFFVVLIFFSYAVVVILRQKRLSEVQKDFINNMTHEFKTPISSIQVSVDLLKKLLPTNNPSEKYLQVIHEQTIRLKEQIERILQISWLEQTQNHLRLKKVDLNHTIQKTVESFQVLIEKKHAQIHLDLQVQHSQIQADEFHLGNILHNLLDNALKYSPENPQITIRTTLETHHICCIIQDNGIGISKNDQEKIFDKFFRVHTGNLHNVKGFGLGLYYVKEMMKAHKGKVLLKSELGKGTSVFLFFQKAA